MTRGQTARALLVALLWGVQFVTSKVGLQTFPPMLFVALRFGGVAAILLPFVGKPERAEWLDLIAISFLYGSLCFGCFFAGLHLSEAGMAAVLAQLMTPFSIIFAWPLLHERPTARIVCGVALAFGGAAFAFSGAGLAASAAGATLVVAGAASQAFGNVLVRRRMTMPPLRLVGWMAFLATPQLLLASILVEHGQPDVIRHAPAVAWASLAYAIVLGAIAAFTLWLGLLRSLPVARVAPFALLQTVFGIAAGAMFLGEHVSLSLAVGAMVCMAGVAITQWTVDSRSLAPGAAR